MRGATSAAPSGGLRVVASGTVASIVIDNGGDITFPSPAAYVAVIAGSGCTFIPPVGENINAVGGVRVKLEIGGMQMHASGATPAGNYYAFGF